LNYQNAPSRLMNIMMLPYCTVRLISARTIRFELQVDHHTVLKGGSSAVRQCWTSLLFFMKGGGADKGFWKSSKAALGGAKYNRGRLRTTTRVFVGVKQNSGRTFLVPVPDHSAVTLLGIIKTWILPSTTVISDCWRPTFVSAMGSSCTTL